MRRCLLVLALLGCDDDGGPTTPPPPDAAVVGDARIVVDMRPADAAPPAPDMRVVDAGAGTLEIDPVRATLRVGEGPAPTQQFTLRRTFAAAEPLAIAADDAAWRVEPGTLGDVVDGLFTSSGRGGEGTVFATHDGAEVMAAITVEAFQDIIVDGTPPGAPERFADAPEGEDCGVEVLYPEPLTAIPRNLDGLSFQWPRGNFDEFAVAFSANGLEVRWFTANDILVPTGDPWKSLLSTANGGTLRFEVWALGDGRVCRSRAIDLIVDPAPLQGAVYYWSTGDAGIMRLPANDPVAEPFLTPAVAPELGCPACHALSRDGERIAFTRTSFPPFGDLAISQVDTPRDLLYDPTGTVGYFPSFAPDGERIVGGNVGSLTIYQVDTGAELERLPIPEGFVSNSPDWSWQGARITAPIGPAGLANPIPDVGIQQGSIAVWALQEDDTWGPAEIVVEQVDAESNDRPAFSPDGALIAFEQKGAGGGGMGNSSARLAIVDEMGNLIPLNRANMMPNQGNSWPKWSPASNQGRLWLAFSSLRDYGHQLDNAGREERRPQIWVTGIRRDAAPGEDPSAPAFWLPGQSVDSGNHIPYWANFEKD